MQTPSTLKHSQLNIQYGLRCDFDVDIRKYSPDGELLSTRRALTACQNLITDAGMNDFASYSVGEVMRYLRVGTGNAAPAFSDVALQTQIAVREANDGASVSYAWNALNTHQMVVTKVFEFPVGGAQGECRELGLSRASNGSLTTRALFKDAFGDPTTVYVAANEQLVVTYRLYIIPNETDSVIIRTIKGVDVTFTFRPAQLSVAGGGSGGSRVLSCLSGGNTQYYTSAYYGAEATIGSLTAAPAGTNSGTFGTSGTQEAYVAGSFNQVETLTIPLSAANYAQIGAILITEPWPFRWQMGISPRIDKTSFDTIKITVRRVWARV